MVKEAIKDSSQARQLEVSQAIQLQEFKEETSLTKKATFFINTEGGIYEYGDYGRKTSYTFPAGSYVELTGVRLNISGLNIECYGGKFDTVTTEFFSEALSKLPPVAANSYHFNSVLIDNDFSGSGWPDRDDFRRYEVEFLTINEFKQLQQSALEGRLTPAGLEKLDKTVPFLRIWAEDNRAKIKQQFAAILTANDNFPKKISALYDDRQQQHITHIVFDFTSKESCCLHIDNTKTFVTSMAPSLRKKIKDTHGIDVLKAREEFSNENSEIIRFTEGSKFIEISFASPSITYTLQEQYSRMIFMLKRLGIPITSVVYRFSPYNLKLTEECVPFALQNKVDFREDKISRPNELVLETATRLRAEQALMAYLLNGKTEIPHFDEDTCSDHDLQYQVEEWYPNYSLVCETLNQKISDLSFEELSKLYLAIDLDEGLSLAPSFKPFLLSCMKEKRKFSEYDELCESSLSVEDSLQLEELLAPDIGYQQNKFLIKRTTRESFNMSAFFKYFEKPKAAGVKDECWVSSHNLLGK